MSQDKQQPIEEEVKQPEEETKNDRQSDVNEESEKKGLFTKKKCKNCSKTEKERDEYKEGWQRAQADYRNLQKEVEKMRGDWVRMSELQILEEFIPVFDNFKKAFAFQTDLSAVDEGIRKSIENWKKGIEYIMQQFGTIMKQHEVEEIKTVDEQFNPELHEALSEEVVEGKEPGTIIREIDAGYTMKGKVIKVAKVVVVA